MVASKRLAKSVRMHRNFLNAFSDASKPYCDEYGRDDVLAFRSRLLEERYGHKHIDTQMNTVITFFKRWLKMPSRESLNTTEELVKKNGVAVPTVT